jgi:hypothetical protein
MTFAEPHFSVTPHHSNNGHFPVRRLSKKKKNQGHFPIRNGTDSEADQGHSNESHGVPSPSIDFSDGRNAPSTRESSDMEVDKICTVEKKVQEGSLHRRSEVRTNL